jgi:tetratricopeptide (TPR) repeat protein
VNTMRNMSVILFLFILVACSVENGTPQGHNSKQVSLDNAVDPVIAAVQPAGFAKQLGTVNFPVSCNGEAAAMVERGVALLHHMSYIESNTLFSQAAEVDPNCAMAYWGTGMTYIHPLWSDQPSDEQILQGQKLVAQARSVSDITAREDAYIDALDSYYKNGLGRGEGERLIDFDRAWEKVYRSYPEDLEAAAFYALMHLAPPRFQAKNKEFVNQKESTEIVKAVLDRVPDHPGAHHYIIHANDFPELADRALAESYNYGKIAPDVPHALHMPSHIFTRRGMWRESVELNTRASAAGLAQSNEIEEIVVHYPHALDYLVYAHLQVGDDPSAEAIRDILRTLDASFHPVNMSASGYALAAIPARVVLEQGNWVQAAQLESGLPTSFPWGEEHAAFESLIQYARAIGGARSDDLDTTRKAIEEIERLGDWVHTNLSDPYWYSQVDVQLLASRAWLAYAEGAVEEGLELMREAAEIENSTDKASVTPGEVLPASEMLGDMLREQARYRDALQSYRDVLEISPNRFNSLFGAGHAAELSGDHELARNYYSQLVEVAGHEVGKRDNLDLALTYLKSY